MELKVIETISYTVMLMIVGMVILYFMDRR